MVELGRGQWCRQMTAVGGKTRVSGDGSSPAESRVQSPQKPTDVYSFTVVELRYLRSLCLRIRDGKEPSVLQWDSVLFGSYHQ